MQGEMTKDDGIALPGIPEKQHLNALVIFTKN